MKTVVLYGLAGIGALSVGIFAVSVIIGASHASSASTTRTGGAQ